MVVGQGRIDGRRAVVQADDFTVRGGAADAAIWEKMVWAERAAHELRVPLVRLVDGTGGGGSVKTLETMGFSYVPPLPGFDLVVENLSRVPVVAAALGPCAGLGAARVVLSHFSVIVRGSAQLFVAGPPVVAAAMGESPDKEELGGARAQTRAGAVDNEAADEDDALRSAAALPGLPAGQRLGGAADRRVQRPGRPARGGAAGHRPARAPPDLPDAPRARARPRRRLGLRARRALRALGRHRASRASTGARSASWPPTPTTTPAG